MADVLPIKLATAQADAVPIARPQRLNAEGRMPALDGLRAISIALVILGHLDGTGGFPELHLSRFIGDYANLGVIIFFVISGFLITTLLMGELKTTGRISLRLFYARRILRLFPAFLLYVSFVIALHMAGAIHLNPGDITSALTYTVNFHNGNSWYIGHLWSLSVEEQFYLLWPAALVMAGLRRSMWLATGMLLLSPVSRIAGVMLHLPGAIFPSVADSLAGGCLLALWGKELMERQWYRRVLESRLLFPVCLLGMFACNWLRSYAVGIAFGISGINLAAVLMVHHAVLIQSRVTRLLSTRILVGIGLLSYSLYLWQQFFLQHGSQTGMFSFPLNIVLAFAAALASYLVVEKPMNRMRKRLRPVAASPRNRVPGERVHAVEP